MLPSSRQFKSSIQTICIGVWCKSAPQSIHALNKEHRFPACLNPCSPFLLYLPPGSPTFCAVFSLAPLSPPLSAWVRSFPALAKAPDSRCTAVVELRPNHQRGRQGFPQNKANYLVSLSAYVQHVSNESTACEFVQSTSIQDAHQICSSLVFMSKHPQGIYSPSI